MDLTKSQEQIYETEQVIGGSVANICGCMLLKTDKSVAEMKKSVIEIFRFNDALRICLKKDPKGIKQYVVPFFEKEIDVIYFEDKRSLDDFSEKHAKTPFVYNENLCDIKVVVLPDCAGILVKFHHIVGDAWTISLIGTQFNDLLDGLNPTCYSYIDHIENEKKYYDSKRYLKDKEYFFSQYAECKEMTHISTKKVDKFTSKRKSFYIDPEKNKKIMDFIHDIESSVFSVFFSCIAIYMSMYSNYNEKFFLGTTVLNRGDQKEKNTMGMFVNTIPILVRIPSESTFNELLNSVTLSSLSAFRHQKFNYSECLKQIIDSDGREAFFDIVVNYQNAKIFGDKVQTTWYPSGMQAESLQIHIEDRDSEDVLKIHYDYQTEKFSEHDIDRLHAHLSTILEDVLEAPDKKINEISMLPSEEKNKLLYEFNNTAVEYEKNTCVYHLFKEHAYKTPEKIAVIFKDEQLSYKQLGALVDIYADKLHYLGINRNDIVAIHLERSSMLIVLQLAVLKIGAIFMPLDKRYPEERINYACTDCSVKLLITDEDFDSTVASTIRINELSAILPTEKAEEIINKGPCYIIYTSGSTGKPKGCVLTGKGLLNFCKNNNTLDTLNEIDNCVFACVNSVSFDYFIAESLLPLTNGFTTVIFDDNESTVQKLFNDVVTNNNINVIMTTPTRLKIYFDDKAASTALLQFRCICTSGEPLTPDLLSHMYNKSPYAKVYNPIGPSECSVWDMGGELYRENGIDIHIGKPIANVQIFIVDKYMKLVPIGVTGEICIAGDGVGAGYLNNPELTEEKFIDNPFGEGKLYKTGDLAYWREDGNIVFVGRNDFQVKVRGLRIELGEIENVISEINGIVHSVVIVRKDDDDRQLICAFYTGKELDSKKLRNILSTKLPKYMIPHVFTHLDEMPLTSSGKINRSALPEVDFNNILSETEYIEPETPEEKALALAVSAVLKTDKVNMVDNFFDIGGDSIKAVYIVSELENLGYETHVSDIMQKDTLMDIAKEIKSISTKNIYDQNEVNGFIPFTPIMRAFLNESKSIPNNFVHTCVLSIDCDEVVAKKAFDAIVSHHDILRGTFTDEGIEVQASDKREAYSFRMIYANDVNEAKDCLYNADTEAGKLVNISFCNLEKESLIAITIHHFLVDLLSWEVIIKDFYTAINQLKNNEEVALSPKTASFMMWNEELQNYSDTITEESKKYWKDINDKLNNIPSLCSCCEKENKAEQYSFALSADISNTLISRTNTTYGTRTNEVLLTALGIAAAKIADGSVGIVVESHGRAELNQMIAIERTVGWFTSCYPVLITDNNNIIDELIKVKEMLRRIPKNGIDYLLLHQGLHKNTDIVFNFYNSSMADADKNQLIAFNSDGAGFQQKINVDCFISENVLKVNISVSECKHKEKICEELGKEFVKQIEKIVDVCTATDNVVKTCSDFSDDELTETELEELKALFDFKDEGNIKDVSSLSPVQEGIYVGYFRNAETKTYNIQGLCEIDKETDLNLIKAGVDLLAIRHPILKTAFVSLKSTGALKQVILEKREPLVTVVSRNELFSRDILDNIISEDYSAVLDLQKDSLFRVYIIDFTDKRFMLFHTHHIILDGWCLPVLINDLQKYYGQLSAGISIEEILEEIRREGLTQTSYIQYVNWIKKQSKTKVSDYWQNLLTDTSFSNVFGKEKKDNDKSEEMVITTRSLSLGQTQAIEHFAKRNKVSYNAVFECAFGVALQKFSGKTEAVYDKVISGRSISLKKIEATVGPFINTIPVRLKSNKNSVLLDLIKEVQKQTIDSDKYGTLPLSDIYKICGLDKKTIDVLFVFENYYIGDVDDIENGPLAPKFMAYEEQTDFSLTVTIFRQNNGYSIRTSYAKDIYTEREITSFIEGYVSILDFYLDEKCYIKDINVTDTEMINSINDTEHAYDISDADTLFSLFEKTVNENSNKVCIKTSEKNLTFNEIKKISEDFDCKIREITECVKSVIAVIAERSAEMYSAIYGIIRGGNAYLPIDPDYPQERINYIIENSNAAAVIAQSKFTDKVSGVPIIDATELLNNYEQELPNVPACSAEPDDTAYVIYTSGSTGNPKGAKISHKSAVNRILWMHDKYPLTENGVILQKTPYTFDVSVWELFWWGLAGGCLAASKPAEHFLPAKILDEVYNNKVTHLHFVPSVFEVFLNYLEAHTEDVYKFNSVRYVFLSGEALAASLVKRFYDLYDCNQVTLHNLYGPTECAVDVTFYDCKPEDTDPIPIGNPIYNTQMYVVDEYLQSVPIGVTGELCIAGMNVGQGYLNNPELTTEKFIDNPFGEGKIYRTGDLAYFREDGNIIFCGRMDGQIKLNGQRIEIGEIETAITEINGVDSVAVVVSRANLNDTLVAFYTGANDCEEEIRDICLSKIPRYMVPAVFVHLESLPLNHSGKLDRKLLSMKDVEITQSKENDMPKNETEVFICNSFSKILGMDTVGRHSDFFELGGTSITMISLLSEKGFENISAAEFMKNSNPAKLARVIKAKTESNFEYLESLYCTEETEKILILFPYAGGGVEAYSNFVNSIKKIDPTVSVYFTRYLHSVEECKKAAKEIADAFEGKEIYFYSHCVGSATSMHILKFLEENEVIIKRYFAGAIIPVKKPIKKNIWNIVPNKVLAGILSKAGAQLSALTTEKVSEILKKFREDTDFANIGFSELNGKIKTPVCVIISKQDIFTKNYKEAERLWKIYAEDVRGVYYIDSKSHYFQSSNSDELVEIIISGI